MQFLKAQWVTLLSGLVIIGAVVATVIGMQSDAVEKAMDKEKSVIGASSIQSLRGDPKNEDIIKAAEASEAHFETEYKDTLKVADQINRREPLMEGVFPEPERSSTPLKFIEAYRQKIEALPRRISAGTLPTEQEYADEAQNVQDLLALEDERQREEQLDSDGRQPEVAATPGGGMAPSGGRFSGGGMAPPGGGRFGGGGMAPSGGGRFGGGGMAPGGGRFGGGGMAPGGAGLRGGAFPTAGGPSRAASTLRAPGNEPKYDPTYRARVSKALDIRCYVESFIQGTHMSPTFHISPIVDASSAPTPADMWYAQVSLWVEQDVADAIASMNKAAAAKVTNADVNVQQMPVKRLKLVRVNGYELKDSTIPFPALGTTGMKQAAEPASTLTGKTANDLYDVVRFQVVAVVDQREIPELVNAISTVNYYVNTGLSYVAVDRAQDQDSEGYFYGTEPVVEVVMDFEGYMLRDVYVPMMPEAVRELLGIKTKNG